MFSQKIEALYKAITLKEIPPEYRGLKVIGRGNTSVILEKDPDTAIMITRDSMKKDWLHFGIGITKDWRIHDIAAERHRFKDFPVFVIEMPKLYPLDADAKRKLNIELKFFNNALKELELGIHDIGKNIGKLLEYYENKGKEHTIMHTLFQFLSDYYPTQWSWDVARRQFAQTKDGELVLVDPIVEQDLVQQMFKVD